MRRAAIDAVAAIPKPTVAAITGYALGSGLSLALAADWRISGDNVKFGATEILAGLVPGGGGCQRLARAVGAHARQGTGLQRPLRRRRRKRWRWDWSTNWWPPTTSSTPRRPGRGRFVDAPPAALAGAKALIDGQLGPAEQVQNATARSSSPARAVRLPCMTDRQDSPAGIVDPMSRAIPLRRRTPPRNRSRRPAHDTKLAQVLYHDWEAESYDDKWSISYDQRCIDYARGRFDAIVPDDEYRKLPYDRALELGCGTGFFLLNLIQAGVARRGSVTDLSPGMVKVATRNGQSLGLDIDGRVADAEGIPYDDNTFDLVVGHAVLHHIPDVELSLREVVRVLKPGGRFVFAGEPTTVGNAYARTLATSPGTSTDPRDEAARAGQLAAAAGRARRELAGRGAGVDRRPAHLRHPPTSSGWPPTPAPCEVRTASEEFTAAMLGWPVRTFESTVPPGQARLGLGADSRSDGWTTLSWVDANVWRRVVPKGWFYNVMITGVKPS